MVICSFLALVLLLHLRPTLRRSLILGVSIRLALLSASPHGTYSSTYRSTCSCISGNSTNHRTANCATSRSSGSTTFLLRRSIAACA